MKQFINLIWANIRFILKDKKMFFTLIGVTLAILAFSLFMKFSSNLDESSSPGRHVVAIISQDGPYAQRLKKAGGIETVIRDRDEAMKQLKENKILTAYDFPKDLEKTLAQGKKPVITQYKVDQGNATALSDQNIEKEINEILRENLLKKNKVEPGLLGNNLISIEKSLPQNTADFDETFPMVMLLYLMLMVAGPLSARLLSLRRDKVLYRLLSTGNPNRQVMGSIFLAYSLIQAFFFSLSAILLFVMNDYGTLNLPITILFIVLISTFNIAMSLLTTRFIKNEAMVSSAAPLIAVILFFGYLASVLPFAKGVMKQAVNVFNLFNPFYWAAHGIEKMRIFPNALILALLIAVVFTAGSYHLTGFSQET